MINGVETESYDVISTHAYESWEVRPQLENPSIQIVGQNQAAESKITHRKMIVTSYPDNWPESGGGE
jgi:hypothetical protein